MQTSLVLQRNQSMMRPKKQYNLLQDPASLTNNELNPGMNALISIITDRDTAAACRSRNSSWNSQTQNVYSLSLVRPQPHHVTTIIRPGKRSIHQSNTSCKWDFLFLKLIKDCKITKSLETVPSQDHKSYICTKYDGLFMNYETVSDGYKVTV